MSETWKSRTEERREEVRDERAGALLTLSPGAAGLSGIISSVVSVLFGE